MISDSIQRAKALDSTKSFIVQAPAGSGKTEILTQRFLSLLACTQKPEEVLALTFTRKAACEMRSRIIDALIMTKESIESSHQQKTFDLAKKVITRNNALNWNLLSNPSRLRILTIDALAANLLKQLSSISSLFNTQIGRASCRERV